MDSRLLVYPDKFSLLEIQSINSMIKIASTKGRGLAMMNKVLLQNDTSVLQQYGLLWIASTSIIFTTSYEDDSVRLLAGKNFRHILKYSVYIPELSRIISNDHINIILRKLLDCCDVSLISCLKCLKSILKYFPGPCGEFKGKLLKFLLPLMHSNRESIQNKAIKCWSYIPFLGGGGKDRKDHAKKWQQQFMELVDAFAFVSKDFWNDGASSNNDIELISAQNVLLSFPAIPSTEPDQLSITLSRCLLLSKCICSMLNNKLCDASILIPVNKVFSIIQEFSLGSIPTMSQKSEMFLHIKYLSQFCCYCLNILRQLIQSCSHYASQASSTINNIFVNFLNMWKEDDFVSFSLHAEIYDVALLWVQCNGWNSKFLCDESAKILLRNLLDDISVKLHNTMNGSCQDATDAKINILSISTTKGENLVQTNVLSKLKIICLKVIHTSIFSHGTHLSAFIHKNLQKKVIKLLLDMTHSPLHPYNRSHGSRVELYRLLLSLVVSPHPAWSPPLHFANFFFNQALLQDKSLVVRSFLFEATSILSKIIRPSIPAFHSSKMLEDFMNKYDHIDNEKTQSLQRVNQVDVQTSTDDLAISFISEKNVPYTNFSSPKVNEEAVKEDIFSSVSKNFEDRNHQKVDSPKNYDDNEHVVRDATDLFRVEENPHGFKSISLIDNFNTSKRTSGDSSSTNSKRAKLNENSFDQSCECTVESASKVISLSGMLQDFVNVGPDN